MKILVSEGSAAETDSNGKSEQNLERRRFEIVRLWDKLYSTEDRKRIAREILVDMKEVITGALDFFKGGGQEKSQKVESTI